MVKVYLLSDRLLPNRIQSHQKIQRNETSIMKNKIGQSKSLI